MAKVLVTGATGFVGKRLIISLLDLGHEVYALCRIRGIGLFAEEHPHFHHIWGDLRNPETQFPADIEAAYYLVHSMAEVVSDLISVEKEVAQSFLQKLKGTAVRQIIYLGGIINDEDSLSPHLKSRLLIEDVLCSSGIPTTRLRASIIIGSGSASFEIIRDLCEKLPCMIAPRWVHSKAQPIAIQDVLFYLAGVLLNVACYDKIFDIGGKEVLTFKDLLLQYSAFRGLKRYIIDVPVLTPYLSSLWLIFITSVRFSLCFYLVESMKNNTVVQRNEIQTILPHTCLTFRKALELAFQSIDENEVVSTWMDAWDIEGIDVSLENYIEVPKEGCLKNVQRFPIRDSKEAAIERIWQIGTDRRSYPWRWTWKLRGFIDKLVGGVGLNRGRKKVIQIGDSIDFWRVLQADKQKGCLILFAAMKLPGEAWLEFKVEQEKEQWFIVQTATFRPKGLLGRVYWYALIPFHMFIFPRMARGLATPAI